MGRNQERMEAIASTCETVLYFKTYCIFFKEIVGDFFVIFLFLFVFILFIIFEGECIFGVFSML